MKVFQGRHFFEHTNCRANLNNIPRSVDRGKVEIVLYKDFYQCGTEVSRLTEDELGDGDKVNDIKYKERFNIKAFLIGIIFSTIKI